MKSMKTLAMSFMLVNLMIGILVYCSTIVGVDEIATTAYPKTWYKVAEEQTLMSYILDDDGNFTDLTYVLQEIISLNVSIENESAVIITGNLPERSRNQDEVSFGISGIAIQIDGNTVTGNKGYTVDSTSYSVIITLQPGEHTITMSGALSYDSTTVPNDGTCFLLVQELLASN